MSSRRGRFSWHSSIVVALLSMAAPALGDSEPTPIAPAQDNSVFEEGLLSNGAGEHLFSGNTSFSDARRALLAFDVSILPARSTVTEVVVQLRCTLSPVVNNASQSFNLHRLTADWGEAGSDAGDPGGMGAPAETGDATWSERFFGQDLPWGTPGGDFVATPSATVSVGSCNGGPPLGVQFLSTPELVADVQGWLDDPSSNFGWILIGNEGANTTARRFASRENGDPTLHPSVLVATEVGDDVPATSPTGLTLLVLLMATASAFVRRRARSVR